MFRNFLFTAVLLLALAPLSRAQYSGNVHSISKRDGLSNGAVNTIARDAEGYMWFGTWNGLNRYDGNSIVTFLPGTGQWAIHNHVVRELFPTRRGPVWMLTNKGISRYDNARNRFYSFFTNESEQINYESDISLAHSDGIGTFAAVYGKGIYRYDSASASFERMDFEASSRKASLSIKRLHIIGQTTCCITGNNRLLAIRGNRLTELARLPLTSAITSSIGIEIGGTPYLLITQRGTSSLVVDVSNDRSTTLSVPNDVITCFATSLRPGQLWFGTEKGRIYSLDAHTLRSELYNIPAGVPGQNPIVTRILTIHESDPGLLWIGTDGNGIYTLRLTHFPNTILSSGSLSYPIVRSILVTSRNLMLIGTKGGGIDIFDSKGVLVRNISVNNGLSNNSVLSFHERADGSIWVGTDGRGIDILSPDLRSVKNFPRDYLPEDAGPGFASVYRILEDSDHRLFIGTSGFGVIMIDFGKNKPSEPVFYEQVTIDKNAPVQKQVVYAIAEERPGIIWIGTRGFGIYRYNTITKRVISQFSSTTHPGVVKNDDILCLLADNKGNIWAGTSAGIFSARAPKQGNVTLAALNLNDELSNTSFHALQRDSSGNLWASNNKGLSYIDLKKRTVISFTSADGLINEEYSDGASFYNTSNGVLYVGGTRGVDMITTSGIRFASYFPPVAINDLLVRNQPVDVSEKSILTRRINLQDKIVLGNNQNSITFNVSPLVYWGRERHRISYRLRNFDDTWILNPVNQAISFTNLSPGSYTLQLRVSDENGIWSGVVREISIIINPPWWKTGWAIAGFILLVISTQFFTVRSYLRRQSRKKEAEMLELTQQKEKELQAYKIDFFTNVAHEFRTPLTLITSHIHMLMEETEEWSRNPRLMKVYGNTLKLQKLVLEIMQFRKLEKGKEPLRITGVNPATLAREVVSDLEPLAAQRNITCEVFCDHEEALIHTDADKYQRVVTNLVSNAIKYNNPGGFVHIRISCDGDGFITEVEDNGIGINPEFKARVFEPFGISTAHKRATFPDYRSSGLGLAVTRGLVELLSGTITYISQPGSGTTFTCRFPDLKPNPLDEKLLVIPPLREPFMVENNGNGGISGSIGSGSNGRNGSNGSSNLNDGSRANILIVDDDPEILDMLGNMLGGFYHIYTAHNGVEALDVIAGNNISLVVSDIMMPEMDGIELCRAIRENFDTSHMPLILLTAKSEIEDRIAGLQAGADSYIPKPFHPEHLKVRIEKLLTNRRNLRNKFISSTFDSATSLDDTTALINELTDPFFTRLLNYIDENIDDDTLLSEKLCESLAISKSSLYNKTKQVLGTTPHGLINQRRLRKASMLLGSTSLTVSEIIDQTGFNSRAHFYELFNKAYGCSPSEYRQKSRIS